MGRKSNKAKEKKRQWKEEVAKEDAAKAAVQAKVDTANLQDDPMSQLLAFKKFDRNGLKLTIGCHKVTNLDQETRDWIFQLTKDNMQTLYEESGEDGWKDKEKREELEEETARYLIARDEENKPVALVHFRYDVDDDEEVLYCYEIQLTKEVRRKGLGKFLMQILELLSHKAQMQKVMLTVFKSNKDGKEFFMNKLKFEVDETSPELDMVEAMYGEGEYTYQILCKKTVPKKPAAKPLQPIHTHTHNGHGCCS